jgi:hypothetical protein
MPDYLLLLYAPPSADRFAQLPLWREVTESLRAAGVLVGNSALESTDSATTVRVRDGAADLTDGPFAVTKEMLAGYYLLRCADQAEAVRYAARLPIAGYGSVEVRRLASG